MMISVLLPTRNRLDYLKLAIETVRLQDSQDWEIVVSDNDSAEDIAGYVASLADERVLYKRTSHFIPVTDNWNEALKMSSGDYVVMLGDDDGLLPGYFKHMDRLVKSFEQPDLVYVGSLLFTYPGIDPDSPDGFLAPNSFAEFFGDDRDPHVLTREQTVAAVRKTMHFRHAFNFNMQLSLISRRLIDELRPHGDFFQSPFPDYYATCASLLKANKVVVDRRPWVVIAVTPKSHGFFVINEREQEARTFLNAGDDSQPQRPGTNMNEGWLGAMEAIEANYGAEFNLSVSRRRYRLVQAGHVYTRSFRGVGSKSEVEQLEATLKVIERQLFRGANVVARALARLLPQRLWNVLSRHALGQHSVWDPEREESIYADPLDVFKRWRTSE